jgi:hypothetical protein
MPHCGCERRIVKTKWKNCTASPQHETNKTTLHQCKDFGTNKCNGFQADVTWFVSLGLASLGTGRALALAIPYLLQSTRLRSILTPYASATYAYTLHDPIADDLCQLTGVILTF